MWTPEMRRRYSWTRREEGLHLTDEEWAVIEPLLPEHDKMGCPWKHGLRTIMDAIVHLLRTGCAWCPTGRRRAARSTSGSAGWPTAAGWRRSTMPCSWRCASFRGARPAQPSASSTARRSRSWLRLGRAGMTTPRKSRVASATSWWTVWLVDSLGHLLAVLVTDGPVQDRDGGID